MGVASGVWTVPPGGSALSPFALVILAAVALAIVRQFQARPIRPLALIAIPAVLILLGVRGHYAGSLVPIAGLLAVDLALSVVLGALRGRSERVWRGSDGVAYRQGTRTTAALWALSIAVRVASALVASPLGVRVARANELTLLLGVSFAAQHAVVAHRVGLLRRPHVAGTVVEP